HHLERRWGVCFPRGGTGSLVAALVDLLRSLGGVLHLATPVERVVPLRAGRRPLHEVRANGSAEAYDVVVSNADLHHTYGRLLRDHPAAARTTRRLEALEWSMSLFVLYFGTDRPYRERLAHHTVLFGPRYE